MARGRAFLGLGLVAVGTVLGGASAVPSGDRQAVLIHRLKHDCGSCHGLTLKGGLGPPLLPATLAQRDENELVEVILDGVAGTPMPPWRDEITADEARWIVRVLKEGSAL